MVIKAGKRCHSELFESSLGTVGMKYNVQLLTQWLNHKVIILWGLVILFSSKIFLLSCGGMDFILLGGWYLANCQVKNESTLTHHNSRTRALFATNEVNSESPLCVQWWNDLGLSWLGAVDKKEFDRKSCLHVKLKNESTLIRHSSCTKALLPTTGVNSKIT